MPAALARVVMVNTADRGGGAEAMAMALVDGFEALGTETWLAVGARHTDHPRVVPFWGSAHVDYRPHAPAWRQRALQVRRCVGRHLGLEDFAHPYTRYLLQLVGHRPDLLVCHNLHGGYFDLTVLAGLSRQVPVVLSLADSWLLTGHCAHPLGCPRWAHGCGSCPDLEIPPAIRRDATGFNWRRKRRIFSRSRLFVVSPSRWLEERAQSSILADGVESWKVVPYGIDIETFTPAPLAESRRRTGLPEGGASVLYVANLGAQNPYKDFATVRGALTELAAKPGHAPLELVVVGREHPPEQVTERLSIRYLPYCSSQRDLAALYRAADVYVHAAVEEPFGLTSAEALACGTPVVAAADGGIREVIDQGRTGILTRPGDVSRFAAAIEQVLSDPARRRRMGQEAARQARDRFDQRRMVSEYHSWCTEVLNRWRREPADRWPLPGEESMHD